MSFLITYNVQTAVVSPERWLESVSPFVHSQCVSSGLHSVVQRGVMEIVAVAAVDEVEQL